MYTFLINEDNTLTVSKRERIMERSKQVILFTFWLTLHTRMLT